MATFSFDDGIRTVGLPMAWALRTRVNRSAMGSVMLMKTSFRVHRYPRKPEINQIVSQHYVGLLCADRRLYQLFSAFSNLDAIVASAAPETGHRMNRRGAPRAPPVRNRGIT